MNLSVEAKIQKWGNSLGLRVSGLIKEVPSFKENTPVLVEVFEDGFSVTKMQAKEKTPLKFTEAELLAALPSASSGELAANLAASEWPYD